jgi:glutaredoxin
MSKNKLLTIIAIIVIVFIGILYFGYTSGNLQKIFFKPKVEVNGIILFYGNGCSHCENVDKFIKENNIEDKIKFTKLEVFNNKENADILIEKANACGLPTDKIGVPFLWDGKNCISGDVDIIKFFENAK